MKEQVHKTLHSVLALESHGFARFGCSVCHGLIWAKSGGEFFVNEASSEALVPRPHQSKMQSMDLVSLLSRPEGKTLEFKRDLSSPEGALKTIVS
ncbi:MAG: hypothetical protein WBX18_04895, partial [Terracidiphilus sp.]